MGEWVAGSMYKYCFVSSPNGSQRNLIVQLVTQNLLKFGRHEFEPGGWFERGWDGPVPQKGKSNPTVLKMGTLKVSSQQTKPHCHFQTTKQAGWTLLVGC